MTASSWTQLAEQANLSSADRKLVPKHLRLLKACFPNFDDIPPQEHLLPILTLPLWTRGADLETISPKDYLEELHQKSQKGFIYTEVVADFLTQVKPPDPKELFNYCAKPTFKTTYLPTWFERFPNHRGIMLAGIATRKQPKLLKKYIPLCTQKQIDEAYDFLAVLAKNPTAKPQIKEGHLLLHSYSKTTDKLLEAIKKPTTDPSASLTLLQNLSIPNLGNEELAKPIGTLIANVLEGRPEGSEELLTLALNLQRPPLFTHFLKQGILPKNPNLKQKIFETAISLRDPQWIATALEAGVRGELWKTFVTCLCHEQMKREQVNDFAEILTGYEEPPTFAELQEWTKGKSNQSILATLAKHCRDAKVQAATSQEFHSAIELG